jgi:hypothetical protein
MRLTSLVWILVLISSTAARADKPCGTAVGAERRDAENQLKAGDAKAALARLTAVKQRCEAKLEPAAQLWLLSDMAFAAHRAGDNERCAELILEVDHDAAVRNPKIAKALLYNAGLCKPKDDCDYKLDREEPVCKMQLAVEYSERTSLTGFAAPPCDVPGHKDAVGLGPGSCIEASGFRIRGEDDHPRGEAEITCPTFQLVDASGKPRKLTFGKPGGGWVQSTSDCCSVREIKVKTERGKVSVLVGSRELSRDCFGGTAATDYLTLYGLTGTQLVIQRDFSISWH